MKERKGQHFNIGVKMIKVLKLKNKQLQVVDKHVEHIREHLSHFHEVWHQTTATITHSPSTPGRTHPSTCAVRSCPCWRSWYSSSSWPSSKMCCAVRYWNAFVCVQCRCTHARLRLDGRGAWPSSDKREEARETVSKTTQCDTGAHRHRKSYQKQGEETEYWGSEYVDNGSDNNDQQEETRKTKKWHENGHEINKNGHEINGRWRCGPEQPTIQAQRKRTTAGVEGDRAKWSDIVHQASFVGQC